jgi:hypothetical protein
MRRPANEKPRANVCDAGQCPKEENHVEPEKCDPARSTVDHYDVAASTHGLI